jgi:hypothetical protein
MHALLYVRTPACVRWSMPYNAAMNAYTLCGAPYTDHVILYAMYYALKYTYLQVTLWPEYSSMLT